MVVTGDRCNRRMRDRPNRLSVLNKFALYVDWTRLLCARPGACGGLWAGLMFFVCSTYVTCVYCGLFDLRRKVTVAEMSVSQKCYRNASV